MKHVCMFSGGASSSYMSFLIARRYPNDTILLHTPAGAEHPDADRFRAQVAEHIGLPITVATCGMTLWEVITKNKCLPGHFVPFCTRILKRQPREKYLLALGEDYTCYVGFGPDEGHRVNAHRDRGGKDVHPLFDMNISNEECKRVIRDEWKICLPEPYKTMKHNNCLPCFKGGVGHFKAVFQNYPEYFAKAVQAEKELDYTVFADKSLAEYAEKWKNEPKQEMLWEIEMPCMCAF